jgi:hypothetical protein
MFPVPTGATFYMTCGNTSFTCSGKGTNMILIITIGKILNTPVMGQIQGTPPGVIKRRLFSSGYTVAQEFPARVKGKIAIIDGTVFYITR